MGSSAPLISPFIAVLCGTESLQRMLSHVALFMPQRVSGLALPKILNLSDLCVRSGVTVCERVFMSQRVKQVVAIHFIDVTKQEIASLPSISSTPRGKKELEAHNS